MCFPFLIPQVILVSAHVLNRLGLENHLKVNKGSWFLIARLTTAAGLCISEKDDFPLNNEYRLTPPAGMESSLLLYVLVSRNRTITDQGKCYMRVQTLCQQRRDARFVE